MQTDRIQPGGAPSERRGEAMSDDLLREFLNETADRLARLDEELQRLRERPEDPALLEHISGAVRVIKGTSGFLELWRLEALAQATEDVVARFGNGAVAATPDAVGLMLASLDRIKEILEAVARNGAEPEGSDDNLIARLEGLARGADGAPAAPATAATAAAAGTGPGGGSFEWMMQVTPRILIVFNPTAGWRRRRRFGRTLRLLQGLGCDWTVRETDGPGDAERFAREVAANIGRRDGYDMVIAAGGDGTINEVIAGLNGSRLPFGILPLGTANVLAAEIGLRMRPADIAAAIADGELHDIHVGLVNGRPFSVAAGVGFDAQVVGRITPTFKRVAGKFAYAWQTLMAILHDRKVDYRVTVDGWAYRAISVIVCKSHYYGGRFVCAPEARLDEPRLHAVMFQRPGRWNKIRYVLGIALGRVGKLRGVEIVAGREITVDGPPGDPVQVDGDILVELPARMTVAPDTMALLRPE